MKKNVMKRVIVCFMVICLISGMTGCGSSKDADNPDAAGGVEAADEKDEKDTDAGDGTDDGGEYILESDRIGINYVLPDLLYNSVGITDYTDSELDEGVFLAEMVYMGLPYEEIYEMIEDGMEGPNGEILSDHTVPVFVILAITGNRSVNDLLKLINEGSEAPIGEDDLKHIASADDCNFYEYLALDTGNYENLDDEFKSEYKELAALKDDMLKNATYTRPLTAADRTVGKKVSFTATDLDGKQVTSEELFSKNEITMVNIWATWCGNCIGEMQELEALNKSLAAKNCAIVGLCGDANDDEHIELAKDIVDEEGVTYRNICSYDGWSDDFDNGGVWPTSFFVDKDGTILTAPVFGARVDEYEKVFDEILSGNTDIKTENKNSCENQDGLYRITVVNEDLEPVEGAMVQYCSDEFCKMDITDKDGTITFNDPPGEYEVHIRKVPEGYDENTETYKTENYYSDMVIVIKRD